MTRLSTLKLKFKFNNAYHQYNEKNKKKEGKDGGI